METFISIVIIIIFIEASYLTYRNFTFSRTARPGDLILDTSVLIDGRIVPLVRSGIVGRRLVVPSFVIDELQFMADKADHDKRERARYGLDTIGQLQRIAGKDGVYISPAKSGGLPVDSALVELAKSTNSHLCTIDYNLNKVASVKNINVVNINEITHATQSVYLPNEILDIEIKQAGQSNNQGVGYTEDGTMVVVDNVKSKIGQRVKAKVQKTIATNAGKMVFASIAAEKNQTTKPNNRKLNNKLSTKQTTQISSPKKPKTQEEVMIELAERQNR